MTDNTPIPTITAPDPEIYHIYYSLTDNQMRNVLTYLTLTKEKVACSLSGIINAEHYTRRDHSAHIHRTTTLYRTGRAWRQNARYKSRVRDGGRVTSLLWNEYFNNWTGNYVTLTGGALDSVEDTGANIAAKMGDIRIEDSCPLLTTFGEDGGIRENLDNRGITHDTVRSFATRDGVERSGFVGGPVEAAFAASLTHRNINSLWLAAQAFLAVDPETGTAKLRRGPLRTRLGFESPKSVTRLAERVFEQDLASELTLDGDHLIVTFGPEVLALRAWFAEINS